MEIVYRDRAGKNIPAVYDIASEKHIKHTIRLEDGARIDANDINLQLIYQPGFSNLPKAPLNYCNEVGIGISLKESQA